MTNIAAQRFEIQQLQINGGTLYSGFSGEQMTRGRDVVTDQTDGVVYETAQYIQQVKPTAEMTTLNLGVILALLGTSGTSPFPSLLLDGSDGMVMVGGQAANGGAYATGTVHQVRTAINGVLWLSSLRWSPNNRAEMALKAMFTSPQDGVTDPIIPSTSALPAQAVPGNGFALFSLTINGTMVVTVNSVELSFDPKFEFEYSTGLPMPVDVFGAGARGALAIRLKADIGDAAVADGTGSVVLVFKQYANGGGFANHSVTFTLHGNFAFEDQFGGSAATPMSKQMTVIPTWDGTTLPVTWTIT